MPEISIDLVISVTPPKAPQVTLETFKAAVNDLAEKMKKFDKEEVPIDATKITLPPGRNLWEEKVRAEDDRRQAALEAYYRKQEQYRRGPDLFPSINYNPSQFYPSQLSGNQERGMSRMGPNIICPVCMKQECDWWYQVIMGDRAGQALRDIMNGIFRGDGAHIPVVEHTTNRRLIIIVGGNNIIIRKIHLQLTLRKKDLRRLTLRLKKWMPP